MAEPVVEQEPAKDVVGESLIDSSDAVLTEKQCAKTKRRPLAFIEDQQIDPPAVVLGQSFIHDFVYTVCAQSPSQWVSGKLYRKIFFKGKLIHSEPQPFDLKPGRWSVKARIEVPPSAKPGNYSLKTEFVGRAKNKRKIRFMKATEFEIVQ
ncbi:hypothetical protein sS8_4199 [Methylocaldum marinum]|uniref:Uncharacterized protein n=1 Tax=Methylocaldum marinum TaxID=1432792 RepID=A0A250L1L5_9GAMM|nr:hypothetical protein sS8_4199 [Methylocaldum marinum]